MQEHFTLNKKPKEESFDFKEQFDKYLVHWKWFFIAIFLSLVIAFLYLRYAVPQYNAVATILVKDERKGGAQSEMTAFAELGVIKNLKNNVDNEIEIIKSRNIIGKAVKKLNFNISQLYHLFKLNSEFYVDLIKTNLSKR